MNPHSAIRNPQFRKEEMIGFTRESFGLSESVSVELFPLEGRGSDRVFFA